jgi:hypothetical protein
MSLSHVLAGSARTVHQAIIDAVLNENTVPLRAMQCCTQLFSCMPYSHMGDGAALLDTAVRLLLQRVTSRGVCEHTSTRIHLCADWDTVVCAYHSASQLMANQYVDAVQRTRLLNSTSAPLFSLWSTCVRAAADAAVSKPCRIAAAQCAQQMCANVVEYANADTIQ